MIKIIRSHWIELGIFIVPFIVYLHNLSQSVYAGDSGDFLSAAVTRGIPHPSGYPLYTMIGIFFTSLPFGGTPAFQFGIFSALISAGSVLVIYLIVYALTKNKLVAVTTALTLAFTYPFWLYSEIVEVFALNTFFILLSLYLTILYIQGKRKKHLLLLAFVLGLSLTNNQTILAVFPGIGLALLFANKKLIRDIKTIAASIGLFVLGLLPYLYIPVAALRKPAINFGNAVTFQNFIDHILRREYGWGVKPYSDFEKYLTKLNLETYAQYWNIHVGIVVIVFALCGLMYLLWKRKWLVLVSVGLSFIFLGPVFAIYSRTDISTYASLAVLEKFYIASIAIGLIFYGVGLHALYELIKPRISIKLQSVIIAIAALILWITPLSLFVKNYPRTNLRNISIGDQLGRNVLETLPQNAIFLANDDSVVFSVLYIKYGFDVRKDVEIPGRQDGLRVILEEAGFPPEAIEGYSKKVRNGLDQSLFNSVVPNLIQKRDSYTDYNYKNSDEHKIIAVPFGVLYKLYREEDYIMSEKEYLDEVEKSLSKIDFSAVTEHETLVSDNLYFAHIRRFYAEGFISISRFLIEHYHDGKTADIYYQKAKDIDPLLLEE